MTYRNKELEIIQKYGATDIEDYTLVNNDGFTCTLGGARFDARHWRNVYGVDVNYYDITGGDALPKDDSAENVWIAIEAMEKELNEVI